MDKTKTLIQSLFLEAGIQINGNAPWDLQVYQDALYQRLLTQTELALGESYMDGWWDCERIDQFFHKIIQARLDRKASVHPAFWRNALNQFLFDKIHQIINFQTKQRSFIVGRQHYDIGNDLYQAMLDKRMVYTCGYWEKATNLEEAQEAKLKLVCQKLDLQPGMTLLDIGCGWGSLLQYAAENYGITGLGITISERQLDLARKRCADLSSVQFQLQDYRDLLKQNLQFDRIASLGMFEHVGSKNYDIYMQVANHCLKEDGLFLLHTIGGNLPSKGTSTWIHEYIFPNGQLPSVSQVSEAFEPYFIMEDWQNIGIHYDKTLMAWHQHFNQHWDELKAHYDDRFKRMWNYYLLSCAGSFRARQNQLWQIVLSKKGLPNGFQRPSS